MSFLCKYMCCVEVSIINVKDHCYTLSWGWEANAVPIPKLAGWLVRLLSLEAVVIQVDNLQHWVHMAAPHILAAQGFVLQKVLQGEESTWQPQSRGCKCRAVLAKGTRYHRRGEEQHNCTSSTETLLLLHVQLWSSSSSTLSLPRHPLTGKRALTALYDSLQTPSCWARLSPLLSLVLALSPLFGVQPHSRSEHHTATELTRCLVPPALPVCHPLPSTSLQLSLFIKVQPSAQQSQEITSPTEKPHHAPGTQCSTEIFLWKKQNIPLKLLLSPLEVGCSALLQK